MVWNSESAACWIWCFPNHIPPCLFQVLEELAAKKAEAEKKEKEKNEKKDKETAKVKKPPKVGKPVRNDSRL